MDAFIRAVEDARHRLSQAEGRTVSVREVVRRAGYGDGERAGVTYHLNPNRHDGTKSHRVPPDLVKRLSDVLPVSEDELAHAAQVAAGYNVVDTSREDPAVVVQRFFGDAEVTEDAKREVTARLLQIIAEQTRRPSNAPTDG